MNILILTSKKSWFVPFAYKLKRILEDMDHQVMIKHNHKKISESFDIVFLLSYFKIVDERFLEKNKHNIVIHASDLPKGRGWSPLTWQILEGKNKIPVSMIEANIEMDAGDIFLKDYLILDGHELIDEIREKLFDLMVQMITKFLKLYPNINPKPQIGDPSYYPRRKPEDSLLDINKSIKDQFNLLRVVDNEQYPAYFNYLGHKYILKIYKCEKDVQN